MSQNVIPFPEKKKRKVRSVLKHCDVVWAAYKWATKNSGCGVVFHELKSLAEEIPDVMALSSSYSVIIECKVSRADFMRDKNKSFRQSEEKGMGDYRYYACPYGLIAKEELPPKWGLIYINEAGKATCIHNVINWSKDNKCKKNKDNEYLMMYTALRRLNLRGHMEEIYDKPYNNDIQRCLIPHSA